MNDFKKIQEKVTFFQNEKNWNIDEIDKLQSDIIEIIKANKEKAKMLGPLIQELMEIKKLIYSANVKNSA